MQRDAESRRRPKPSPRTPRRTGAARTIRRSAAAPGPAAEWRRSARAARRRTHGDRTQGTATVPLGRGVLCVRVRTQARVACSGARGGARCARAHRFVVRRVALQDGVHARKVRRRELELRLRVVVGRVAVLRVARAGRAVPGRGVQRSATTTRGRSANRCAALCTSAGVGPGPTRRVRPPGRGASIRGASVWRPTPGSRRWTSRGHERPGSRTPPQPRPRGRAARPRPAAAAPWRLAERPPRSAGLPARGAVCGTHPSCTHCCVVHTH